MMSETTFIRQFGANLKDMLEYCNTTQRELSEDTGISETTISRYTNGQIMPSLKHVVNIMCALECEFSDLVDTYTMIE